MYLYNLLISVSSTDVIVFFSVLLAALLWLRNGRFNRRLPPGPYSLPVVGYLPLLTFKPYVRLWELSKEYGPVFSIRLGNRYTVVLNDYRSIKEAFNQDAFMGRPPESPFELSEETLKTGAFNGLEWREQRKFAMHVFRDLGLGKSALEQHIREEIAELVGRMEKLRGRPVNVSKMLAPSMSNNIASLVFGKRRRHDDPKRIELDLVQRQIGQLVGKTAWLLFFPWLKRAAQVLGLTKQKELSQALAANRKYFDEEIAEHQRNLDTNDLKDFINAYLLEVGKTKDDPNSTFKIPVMRDLIGAFFGAGSETVKISLDWLLLICSSNPEIQIKVQHEIDAVIGHGRWPCKEDQKKMPYTTAVNMEMMRWITTLPLNLFRYTLEDTELLSHYIPKHTYVLANFWAVHHDPKIWGNDANRFKPERFLSADGKQVKKSEYLIPFSIGKRSCPGESLATMEVFLYFTSFLQRFSFRLAENVDPDFDGLFGVGLSPKPYELVYEVRNRQ